MSSYDLDQDDIQNIIASLLLAEMDQNTRFTFSENASLPASFVPAPVFERFHHIHETLDHMFGVSTLFTPDMTLEQMADRVHDKWLSSKKQVTVFTSGSTGKPKPATHHLSIYVQEVEALAKVFDGRQRLMSFVPQHHIYGFLFSILLPKVMRIARRQNTPLPMPNLTASLLPGDLVIAFPLFWNTILKFGTPFGPDINGVTSTGPCPAETITGLQGIGLRTMYEIYGSSETGGVGYRTSPDSMYTLLSHWDKGTTEDVLVRIHPTGEAKEYPLQDDMLWKGMNFIPQKRSDKCVQVAGVNVSPAHVVETLMTHPNVQQCSVRLMRQEEGSRLKAFIVPKHTNERDELVIKLRQWAKKRLSTHELPGAWKVGDEIPKTPMGKLSDW